MMFVSDCQRQFEIEIFASNSGNKCGKANIELTCLRKLWVAHLFVWANESHKKSFIFVIRITNR